MQEAGEDLSSSKLDRKEEYITTNRHPKDNVTMNERKEINQAT
jgi:hypothetical protein